MGSRMLRDWTNSDKIDSISFQAEVFFTRLIMKADDFGCFWADSKRLKANLFPLKSDSIRDADITRWKAECQKAGLIVVYESDSKEYLHILEFNQRLRTKNRKFPAPPVDSEVLTIDGNMPPEVEEEVEEKKEVELHKHVKKKGWNTRPGKESMNLELPEIKIGAVIQQYRFTKNIKAVPEQVLGLWEVFKSQHFTGEKYYQSPQEAFSHFINWSKTRELPEMATVKKATASNSVEKLRKLHEDGITE